MEHLKQPYNLVSSARTAEFRAPESLSKVHLLGKSPIIEHGDLVMAKPASRFRYLAEKFGDDAHGPSVGTAEYLRHEELLEYVESSFAGVDMKGLLSKLDGRGSSTEIPEALQKNYDCIAQRRPSRICSFPTFRRTCRRRDFWMMRRGSRPNWTALQNRSGYLAAIANASPMDHDS